MTSPAPDWRVVVTELDTARDRAFADAEPDDLDTVYTTTSSARDRDVETLQSLASRGLHVVGWHTTPVAVSPVRTSSTTATLRVTDEQSGYRLVDGDGHIAGHGQGRGKRTFTMSLDRQSNGWRIAAIIN